jgi:hypothetical protein
MRRRVNQCASTASVPVPREFAGTSLFCGYWGVVCGGIGGLVDELGGGGGRGGGESISGAVDTRNPSAFAIIRTGIVCRITPILSGGILNSNRIR